MGAYCDMISELRNDQVCDLITKIFYIMMTPILLIELIIFISIPFITFFKNGNILHIR